MASLHKLLSDEGFERQRYQKPNKKKVKFKDRSNVREDSITLPIYICLDRRSFDSKIQRANKKALSLKASSVSSSKRGGGSASEKSNTESATWESPRRDEPAIDDVAIKAMVSILSGYVGQYLRDRKFRHIIREKCRSCFERRRMNKPSDNEIFAHMEMGIQSIERLVESQDVMDLESLQKSIKILKIVASLDSKTSSTDDDSACGNSFISACSHLYLSIVYKIGKNDKISARHLLQVFSDSPFLSRTHLLPELWEHFFLPHLLHLKIWYNKELDFVASSGYSDKEKKIKALSDQYNDQMDTGTKQLALYYMEWLKVGGQAPSIPLVPSPSKPAYARSRRKSSDSSTSYHSVSNKSLYQAVFGPIVKGRSMDMDNGNGALEYAWDVNVEDKACTVEEYIKHCSHVEKKSASHRRSSSQNYRTQKAELWPNNQKSDYFRFLGCRTEPAECLVERNYMFNDEKIKNVQKTPQSNEITTTTIATICSSESLSDCELAIRAVSEAWLNSQGDDTLIESSLSQSSVIQGIMEVLYMSNNDEILELGISILAELATRNEMNRRCILNSDPQLDVSLRLLRSSSLFLKAAILLYILKPKAKQMVSMEWVPLVLRVLEFGDQLQTLFTVRCSPHEAAYYFLDQLLTGFDEDKNLENSRQIISLGGLSLLARRMDVGDICEKSKAASILHCCIQADGSSRHYVATNLNKETIISLLVLGKKTSNSHGHALALLTELLCLSRRKQRMELLMELTKGWDCLNTLHILLLHLRRARLEEQPVIAVILLQLDLLGDPLEYSICREEAIDAIVKALDCWVFDEKIQEASARALLILGGHFSYNGEPDVERWLLTKAGLNENTDNLNNEEEKNAENWQRKTARVLLTSGKRRLITALSDSIANSIPCLARASLVTVCWMSIGLHSLGDRDLQVDACSILVPQLIEFLNENTVNLEEKILSSFSLHNLTKGIDYLSRPPRLEKKVLDSLRKLSRVTWTAKELISLITSHICNPLP